MKRTATAIAFLLALGLTTVAVVMARNTGDTPDELVAHGRYLVQIAGCNDCHTPGYAQAEGKVDESLWLTGDSVGWQGPWGTTYPINLRLYMNTLSEEEWLKVARTMRSRPPMPYFNVAAMTDRDLRALHRYIRTMGPAGEPAPAYLPPGVEAQTPVVRF